MLFHTERLYVRRLEPIDFPPFHEMQSNAEVLRYTTGKPQNEEENRVDLQELIRGYEKKENTLWVWAIIKKLDHSFVGTCAIAKTDEDENEIGYRLLQKYWGNGYGFEIAEALLKYGIQEMGFLELVAYVDVRNIPSVKILEKSSMRFVKEFFNEKCGSLDRKYVFGERDLPHRP